MVDGKFSDPHIGLSRLSDFWAKICPTFFYLYTGIYGSLKLIL